MSLLLLPSEWPGFYSLDGGRGLLPDISVQVDVTNNPTNPTRVWTDVTKQLREITFTRSGRNDELNRTETGTLTGLLNNRGNAVTSLGIRKSQWIRVRALWNGVTYARWQGILEATPREWPHAGKDSVMLIRAAGTFKVFRLYDLDGQTFAAQRGDQRVAAIAALVGITTGAIDTDTDALDAISSPIARDTDALSVLLDIEESENGLLVENPNGTLSFQGRHYRMLNSAVSRATFGEAAGQIPYRDNVQLTDDDEYLWNDVSVTPNGGSPQSVYDTTSKDQNFTRRLNRTLLTSSPIVALDAANYLLNRYKNPSPRIPQLEVQLAAVAKKVPSLMPVLLSASNSDRFTWTRAATSPISEDVYVERITDTIRPGPVGWTIGLQLSPADDESGWVLGDAVLGVLGTTTRLVY